jgi:hypothetical protein
MAEPQAAKEARSGNGAEAERIRAEAERGRQDGPRAQAERASWAEPAAQIREQQRQLGEAAGETAGVFAQDWASTAMALYARNLSMASRRARAVADYLDDLARARQPAEVMNAGASYWSRLIGDYSNFTVGEGGLVKDLIASRRPDR